MRVAKSASRGQNRLGSCHDRAANVCARAGFDTESELGEDSAGGNEVQQDRIGARIKVMAQTVSPQTQIGDVKSCNGYYSGSDQRVHFGLGEAKKVDLVEIRWPSAGGGEQKDVRQGKTPKMIRVLRIVFD